VLGEVTAVFAHEVRNPINNISTGLQLISLNLPAQDQNQETLSRLQQDCDRLEELMKSVLAFSRHSDYVMEPLDLGQLVRRLLERMRPRLNGARVTSDLHIAKELPEISGNSRALEQVFSNLFNNAMQAMSENGGTMTVKLRSIEGSSGRRVVEVSVSDTGPGIPPEFLERIFQPFFTTKTGGTGIGLAITKRIITAHKGNIQVRSIPGATVFTLQFTALPARNNPEDGLVLNNLPL
jgi:signal transduction histidine kinase